MAYYNECPICGANLDPGEVCYCLEEHKKRGEENNVKLRKNGKNKGRLLCLQGTQLCDFTQKNL